MLWAHNVGLMDAVAWAGETHRVLWRMVRAGGVAGAGLMAGKGSARAEVARRKRTTCIVGDRRTVSEEVFPGHDSYRGLLLQ